MRVNIRMQGAPVCLANCFNDEPWRGRVESDAPESGMTSAHEVRSLPLLAKFALGLTKCLPNSLKLFFKMQSLLRRLPQRSLSHLRPRAHFLML